MIAVENTDGFREYEKKAIAHLLIEHLYGHLEIPCCGCLRLTGVEYRKAVESRREEIEAFCRTITKEAKTDET